MKVLKKICLILCTIIIGMTPMKTFASSNPDTVNDSQTSDGNENNGTVSDTTKKENVKFTPKVIVECCRISGENVEAGDEVRVTIVLKNTSKTEKLRNMTVTVTEQGEYLKLLSDTDTVYIDTVTAGGNCEVTYIYQVEKTTPEGQYILDVAMDYADASGASYTAVGKARIDVEQPVRMTFDPVAINQQVQIGDIIRVDAQAINLGRGKVLNVRAVIEGDGIQPEGTLFIGDLEPGTTGSGSVNVTISGLSKGNTPYGNAEGTVTFYYEDEAGRPYEETREISTCIEAPVTAEEAERDVPEQIGQWWMIMAVIAALLTLVASGIALRIVKHRRM